MVNFVETFYNIKVTRMITEWFSDDMGTMYFVNVQKLKHIPHQRFYITTENYYKKLEEKAKKMLTLSQTLEQKYKHLENSNLV